MLNVLKDLKNVYQLKGAIIDNPLFRLHYKVTVLILIACSLVITSKQYFGNPMYCSPSSDKELYSQSMVDNYCWTHTTFTLPEAYSRKDAPYPGISKSTKKTPKLYHAYYQWVHIILFIQAILFYIPHLIWKMVEHGRLGGLILNLQESLIEEEKVQEQYQLLTGYLVASKGSYNVNTWVYIFCEFLNMVNSISQIYLIDAFLGGEFTNYGVEVLKFISMEHVNRTDPMARVFPLMTKCVFYKFGPSGDVQNHEILCLLPHNVVNEKIYVFFWVWFLALAILSSILLIYRLAMVFFKHVRICVLCLRHPYTERSVFADLVQHLPLGDWFLLHLLGKNLDTIHFRQVVGLLHEKLMENQKLMANQKPLAATSGGSNITVCGRKSQRSNNQKLEASNYRKATSGTFEYFDYRQQRSVSASALEHTPCLQPGNGSKEKM